MPRFLQPYYAFRALNLEHYRQTAEQEITRLTSDQILCWPQRLPRQESCEQASPAAWRAAAWRREQGGPEQMGCWRNGTGRWSCTFCRGCWTPGAGSARPLAAAPPTPVTWTANNPLPMASRHWHKMPHLCEGVREVELVQHLLNFIHYVCHH
eukprot:scaffold38251_cov34-Prasinocladus_malaysianus.AAC.2